MFAYVFIEFEYNQDVYEIENTYGWEKIYETSGNIIFQGLSNDDMVVTVKAYGISTEVCHNNNVDAWNDYETQSS